MPELPEVETIRAGLAPLVRGRTLAQVRVLHPRPVRRHAGGPADFQTSLVGRTFAIPARRGKYLWLPFDDGDALLVHLGMSGQFRLSQKDDELARNTRVLFDFIDGNDQLRFIDQRMFGGLSVSGAGAELPAEVRHIALDPLDPSFDLSATVTRLQQKRSTVKRALLDQNLISGIGNIYADEALWRARTHYDHPTSSLSTRRARSLLRAVQQVFTEALVQGGTSFDSLYVNVNGRSGYFARSLAAYGQAGKPCPRCGTPIRRDHFMNRSSYLCPRCQRLPRG